MFLLVSKKQPNIYNVIHTAHNVKLLSACTIAIPMLGIFHFSVWFDLLALSAVKFNITLNVTLLLVLNWLIVSIPTVRFIILFSSSSLYFPSTKHRICVANIWLKVVILGLDSNEKSNIGKSVSVALGALVGTCCCCFFFFVGWFN